MNHHLFAVFLSAALASGPALSAQTSPPPAAGQPSITLDGGEAQATRKRAENRKRADDMVCTRTAEIGSKLPGKKVCMTRAQMNQRKQHDRDWIERSQVSRPTTGG